MTAAQLAELIRAHIASQAMIGLLQVPRERLEHIRRPEETETEEVIARKAVDLADALVSELEKRD